MELSAARRKYILLKDDPSAAEKCLSMLEKTLFFRNWAKPYRNTSIVRRRHSGSERFAEIKSRMVKKDFIVHPDFPEKDLEFITTQNPANKMAFEYVIAHYLLMGLPDRLVDRIENLRTFALYPIPASF